MSKVKFINIILTSSIVTGLIVTTIFIGAGVYWAEIVNSEIVAQNSFIQPIPDQIQEKEPPHQISLPGLMIKEYNGHSLKIGKKLAQNPVYTRYYITYGSGDLAISGIMNVPKGEGPFPVLFLNHGFISPVVYTNGRGLKREQDYLARQGYVVIHSDYRNHADSDKDEENNFNFRLGYTEDIINAILAVKNSDLEFFDKNNIGMLGHSMGGGIALNIMVVKPSLVKAFVLFAPIASDHMYNYDKWLRNSDAGERIIETYGQYEDNIKFWENLSARNFFENVQAPIMIHHGTIDKSVPIEWSEDTIDYLQKAGKDVTFHIYENEPHEFTKAWNLVMERTTEFFDEFLKN